MTDAKTFPEGQQPEIMTPEIIDWASLTPEEFLYIAESDILRYGKALEEVRAVYKNVIHGNIEEDTMMQAIKEEHHATSSRTNRQAADKGRHQLRETGLTLLAKARFNAQDTILFGDPTRIQAQRGTQKLEHTVLTNRESAVTSHDHYYVYAATVSTQAYEAEVKSCLGERALHKTISDYLNANNWHVVELLDHLQSDSFNKQAYQPLLVFMAKFQLDPAVTVKPLEQAIDRLEKQPEKSAGLFCEIADWALATENDALLEQLLGPEGNEYLKYFLPKISNSQAPISQVFQPEAPDSWPSPLKGQLDSFLRQIATDLRKKYQALLETHTTRIHAIVTEEELTKRGFTERTAPKKTGRTTQKSKSGKSNYTLTVDRDIEAAERAQVIQRPSVAQVIKTDIGYFTQELRDPEEVDDFDPLQQIPTLKKYLGDYTSDPNLADDMQRMVSAILADPVQPDETLNNIRFTLHLPDGTFKQLPVRRLNPNRRGDLPVGDTAKQSRIYFAVYTANGRPVVCFIKAINKNLAAKISNMKDIL